MSNRWQRWVFSGGWTVLLSFGLVWSNGFPRYDEGPLGLALALRKLPVTGSLLHTAAHPDDEDNSLLVMLSRGRGIRTGLLTLTRGDGGQNEIGPELFQAIGIIRTGELLSMHRWTGAEQFFSRAYEFGYSFSVEETLQKWGREEILADMVRLIRRFRPNVIISLNRAGTGGGQHHQTSARLTEEAFRAAADPNRFPEQLGEGLHPWQALKLYERYGGGGRRGGRSNRPESEPGVATMQTGAFDPLFDRTYAEIGLEARSMHKCQGTGQLGTLPGPRTSQWRLVDSAIEGAETHQDLLEGIETGLQAIFLHAGSERERVPFLETEVNRLQSIVDEVEKDFVMTAPAGIVKPLARGLSLVRELRTRIGASSLSSERKYQVGFLLEKKEADFVKALQLARQFRVEVLVEDGLVVPGQTVEVTVTATNASAETLELGRIDLATSRDWRATPSGEIPAHLEPHQVARWTYAVQVGPNPRFTGPFWHRKEDPSIDRFDIEEGADVNAPWSAPAILFTAELSVEGVPVPVQRAAEFRYPGPWVGGEQRHELMVVPAVSVSVTPEVGILPLGSSAGTEVRVTALYNGVEAATGRVSLQAPPGWRIEPAFQPLEFELEGQSITRRFRVFPASGLREGNYPVSATVELQGQSFQSGYQVIDYDHIERRHLYHPARTEIRAVDVRVAADLKLGYVVGVGDDVPPALHQLGLDVTFLNEDDLAFGDLSRFDTIVTGVRAYLNREDLKANNARLLDWVEAGGTLIVQYNKFEFNGRGRDSSPYAPYPLQVSSGRVTDENAPVRIRVQDHPVFQSPNRIGAGDWDHWVQERGLYFLGEKSDQYADLVTTADPFEYNSGEKLGALVEARHGKGRWIYVGLGLWRQLPAGVPGAFRLMANLVSLGRKDPVSR